MRISDCNETIMFGLIVAGHLAANVAASELNARYLSDRRHSADRRSAFGSRLSTLSRWRSIRDGMPTDSPGKIAIGPNTQHGAA
jgi:hypothetical protein